MSQDIENFKLIKAEGHGWHIRNAEELYRLINELLARIEILEGG